MAFKAFWYGHVEHMAINRLVKKTYDCIAEGKRRRDSKRDEQIL